MVTRNTRLHPDALIPIGNTTVDTTNGSVSLTVPTGASGIIMQNLGTAGSYWSFQLMSGSATGFKFTTAKEVVWFSSQIPTIYLWLADADSVVYQFVAPVSY